MNNEYIIVDKTKILQRIEELESKIIPNPDNDSSIDSYNLLYIAKQNALHEFLSNSIPLIPEIEKAFIESRRQEKWAGGHVYGDGCNEEEDLTDFKYKKSENYIISLKLEL